MSESDVPADGALPPSQVIGRAIQDIMATRLGRGFVPLGLLFVLGVIDFARSPDVPSGALAPVGAVVAAAAMLGYGLRIVQLAFGRSRRPWMALASIGSMAPPLFALCALGWLGLRGLTMGGGVWGGLAAILHVALGVWVLRCWMKVVEVERLARVMAMNLDEEGGPV